MIKVEDLRIGDIVRVCCDCEFSEGTVCTVSEIGIINIIEERKGIVSLIPINGINDNSLEVWCSDIEGIPLTPEILKKNGWISYKKLPLSYEHKGYRFGVEFQSHSELVSVSIGLMIFHRFKYIHELQHILWALGIDTEFKI